MRHPTLTRMASGIWFAIAAYLLWKGTSLLEVALHEGGGVPLKFLTHWAGGVEVACSVLIAVAGLCGLLKGRYVLVKSAHRLHLRIRTLPEPAPIFRVFSPLQYLLLLVMMGLGMTLRTLGTPPEIRGALLVAVSAALSMGGIRLLRLATGIVPQ